MFTGIITAIGTITVITAEGDGYQLTIETPHLDTSTLVLGASVAVSGICLTVTGKGEDWFTVQLSPETLTVTTAGSWVTGQQVNLERALKVGDELGGHFVSGHVDSVVTGSFQPCGEFTALTIIFPLTLEKFIVPKGSVTIDGISLTVNEVHSGSATLMLIPHTLNNTTMQYKKSGDEFNLEIDLLARYVVGSATTLLLSNK